MLLMYFRTIEELGSFLLLNNGKNFVKSHGRDTQKFVTKQGLDKTFVECEFRMWRIGDRKLPAGKQSYNIYNFYMQQFCNLQLFIRLNICF